MSVGRNGNIAGEKKLQARVQRRCASRSQARVHLDEWPALGRHRQPPAWPQVIRKWRCSSASPPERRHWPSAGRSEQFAKNAEAGHDQHDQRPDHRTT